MHPEGLKHSFPFSARSHVSNAENKGQKIGGYLLDERIGKGGMGLVFKAKQLSTDRWVALKVLSPKLSKNQIYTSRFLREAQSAGKLNHANIVSAIDVGQADGYFYFAMELVEGETLKAAIKRQGFLDERRALEITYYIAHGLEHAHINGLIHRDIKPDNILLDNEGIPKLADFGLAKAPDDTTVTLAGTIIGTPDYISPEQAKGASLDIRSDIYSLGATLYHSVVGRPPFKGETAGVILHLHIHEQAILADEANEAVSPETSKVLEKMMEKDPAKRYQTPTEVIEDLELVMKGEKPRAAKSYTGLREAIEGRKAVRAEDKKKSPAGILGLVAMLALAAGGYFMFFNNSAPEPTPSPATTIPGSVPAVASDAPGTNTDSALPAADNTDAPEPALEIEPVPVPESVELLEQIKAAKVYQEENPDDLKGQLDRYQAVLALYEGKPAAEFARQAIARIEKRWDAAASKALAPIADQVNKSLEKSQFAQAQAELKKFPEALRNAKWEKQVDGLNALVAGVANKAFEKLDLEARAAADAGDIQKAVDLYTKAAAFGVAEIKLKAEELIAPLKEALKNRQSAIAVIAERSAYLRHWMDLAVEITAKDYEKALAMHQKAKRKFETEQVLAEFKKDEDDIRLLLGLLGRVEEGLLTYKKGQAIVIGGMQGTFEGVKDGRVSIKSKLVENLEVYLDRLSLAERLWLAQRALDKTLPEVDIIRALFSIYSERTRESTTRKHIAAAQQKGAEVAHLEDLLVRREKAEEEDKARKLDASASKSLQRGHASAESEFKELLEKFGETFYVQARKDEIKKILESFSHWPKFDNGLVCGWLAKPYRNTGQAESDWLTKLTPRDKAGVQEDGLLQVTNGAFTAPQVNKSLLEACRKTGALTIEGIFIPNNLKQVGPARIISFSLDGGTRNFTLGQSGENLILRLRASESGPTGNGTERTLCAIPPDMFCHVIVSYGENELVCWLNGAKKLETKEYRGDFSTWEEFFFVLGDEYKENREWGGRILGFAIYNRAMREEEAMANFEAISKKLAESGNEE